MKKIRLLLIEDNRLLRDGLISILNPYKDINVATASGDRNKIVSAIQKLKPNLALLDLGLRSQNSLHLVEVIRKDFPAVKIIVMDLAPVQADILDYVKAGANGFILKDASLSEFIITIRSVFEGANVLPPLLVDSLFSKIVENAVREGKSKFNNAVKLTKREQEVINLLSDGLSNLEIGKKMHITFFSVKSHIHNIMEKLALHSRIEIAQYHYTDQTVRTITESISNN